MDEPDPLDGYKLLLVPVSRTEQTESDRRDGNAYVARDSASAVSLGPFDVVDVPPGVTAHAVSSAVAALLLGMPAGATPAGDWTIDAQTGRSNSSPRYRALVAEVEQLIREGGGYCLDPQWVRQKAGLVMAQLAHVHGLAPVGAASATVREAAE